MATIYQHPSSKYWFARFTDQHGKRVSRSTKSTVKKDAKIIAGKFEAQERDERLRAGAPAVLRRAVELAVLEAQSGRLTLQRAEDLIRQMAADANPTAKEANFRRFSAAWLDGIEGDISEQSRKSYQYAVKMALATLGDKSEGPIRKITRDDVTAIQSAFAAGGAGGRTVNMNMEIIRRIFADAVKDGALDRSPALSIKPMKTTDSIDRLPFTVGEVRSLIGAAPSDEWKGLILLASQTGIRCGDLRGLTSENVEGAWLTILPSKTSKTTGKVVKMPLSKPCLKWLAGRTDGPLFPELTKLHKQRVAETFDSIMSKAQVEKVIVIAPGDPPKIGRRSFHSLRHSFTSWLASADVASDVRKKLTGHSSDEVHANYSHHSDALERAVAKLPTL